MLSAKKEHKKGEGSMQAERARQIAQGLFKKLRGYKRWEYRKDILKSFIPFFELGINVEVADDHVSFERMNLRMTFRKNGTIVRVCHDKRGTIQVDLHSDEDFLIELLTRSTMEK